MANKFDDIVEGKHSEEKELSGKKGKEKKIKDHDDVKEITIRFRPIFIERIIYVIVILVLVFLVFRSPFCKLDAVDSDELVEDETEQAEDVEIIEEETTEESVSSEGAELVVNASLSVRAADIVIVNATGTSYKVEKIDFKVINSGDIFRGKIEIFWYDEDDTDVIKDKVRASKALIVPAGEAMSFSATDFEGSYLSSLNEEETFILKLSDADGNLLDSVEIERTP
jgi:hypothetical protein